MPDIPKRWKGVCRTGTDFNSSLCNRKLIGVNYFNQGVLAVNPGAKIAVNSARDSYGHGTHVASIAAGNYAKGVSYFGYAKGTAKGVSPRARLAIYKTTWPEFSTSTADVIAAMDQAIADGVDIISISSGFRHIPLYEDSIAIAAFGAMTKGTLVSASAGNRGPDIGTLGNGAAWIMTVASGTTDRTFAGTLTLGNGQNIRGWSLFPLSALIKGSTVVYNKTLSSCNSTELLSQVNFLSNEVIVCNASEELFFQMDRVMKVGFRAAIFISSDPRAFASKNFPIPGILIGPKEDRQVINYITQTENPSVSINFQETYVDVKPAPKLALSSSRGPSRSYLGIAKPDLMAPGVLIVGAWLPDKFATRVGRSLDLESDYILESGTSMACPHASGIAAMLKAVHPEWSPSAIKSAMMTTANPLDNTQNRIIDSDTNEPATPLGMGAGFVDPNRALDPGLIYDATPQDYVNLLCSMNFTEAQFKTIARSSANDNGSNPSADLHYPSFIALWESDLERKNFPWLVKKFTRTVTNVGSGAAKYTAKVEVPRNARISVSPQVLAFGKKYEKKSYTLTICYRGDRTFGVSYGTITWVEENGNHTVRSPISVHPTIEVWGS